VTDVEEVELRPKSRRGSVLLALGAAAGVVIAALGLVGPGRNAGAALPRGAVARVNGEIIGAEDYQRVVAALGSDRRDGVDDTQRRHVLDRLIDEELLIQRGLELGFARHDRKVRGDLSAAVIASVVSEYEDLQPSAAELQAFYDQHRDFFTQPGRLRLQQVFCKVATPEDAPAALERAREASRRLRAQEPYDAVRRDWGDAELSPLPDALLPPAKLLDYLGPTALQASLALGAGEVSDPIRSGTGYRVLQVVERQPDTTPPLAEIEPEVRAEFRRRAGEQALRAYLDDLRSRADVAVAPTLP
jgi:hypothetical protein